MATGATKEINQVQRERVTERGRGDLFLSRALLPLYIVIPAWFASLT